MDIIIKWMDKTGAWHDFNSADILHMPLKHACHLFNTSTPVVVKQDDAYIVNTEDLRKKYRKSGKFVTEFKTILSTAGGNLDRKLCDVGFIQKEGV